MKPSQIDLSIIIVNYNSGDFLYKCLDSLNKVSSEAKFTIYVADNNSSDKSFEEAKMNYFAVNYGVSLRENSSRTIHTSTKAGYSGSKIKFPKIKFIKNSQNLGFSKANNVLLKLAKTEYILLLNPDSLVLPGTIKYMLDFMDTHPDTGAASCRVELADGSLDWASHRGFPTPWASFLYFILGNDSLYHLSRKDMTKLHEVDAIVGAFMLLRKSVLDKIGLFDEDYFMYAEDIDLCFRIKQAGYKIMYIPQVKIIHFKGVTSGIKKHTQQISQASQQAKSRALNAFYETMGIFYKKHLKKNYPFFINWLVYIGIKFKWMLAKRKLTV